MQHCLTVVFRIFCLFCLTACAGKVDIGSKFPTPVVKPLQFHVATYYSPKFTQYVYENKDSGINFTFGEQQKALFDQVFDAMFTDRLVLSSLETDSKVDFIIEPKLSEVAFLNPKDTDTNFYSASLKYDVYLYSASGQLILIWPLVAYGRNRTQMLYPRQALGEALNTALRDAAAKVVSQLSAVIEQMPPPLESK